MLESGVELILGSHRTFGFCSKLPLISLQLFIPATTTPTTDSTTTPTTDSTTTPTTDSTTTSFCYYYGYYYTNYKFYYY